MWSILFGSLCFGNPLFFQVIKKNNIQKFGSVCYLWRQMKFSFNLWWAECTLNIFKVVCCASQVVSSCWALCCLQKKKKRKKQFTWYFQHFKEWNLSKNPSWKSSLKQSGLLWWKWGVKLPRCYSKWHGIVPNGKAVPMFSEAHIIFVGLSNMYLCSLSVCSPIVPLTTG